MANYCSFDKGIKYEENLIMSSVLQLIYQLSVCAFVFQSLQSTVKCLESYLHSISNSRPVSYSLKEHSLYLYAAAKPKDICSFIQESVRIIWNGTRLQFSECKVWTWRKVRGQCRKMKSSRCIAARPKGQLSTASGGENMGESASAVWKNGPVRVPFN